MLAAQRAGMRYIVITAKHHDGFAMYRSSASRYNLMDWTAYRGPDPLQALRDACRRHGLLFGIYYSPLEFRISPKGFRPGDEQAVAAGFRYETLGPRPYASNVDVVQLAKAQIRELATRYRPDILWFDGTWDKMGTWTSDDAKETEQSIRSVLPDVLINNRLGAQRADFNTIEGALPGRTPGGTWEYCWNLGKFWGYNPRNYEPRNVGVPEQYIETLVRTASMGGNYLLNVGPEPTGRLPAVAVDYLEKIGAWVTTHGECIYGVDANPFPKKPEWGYVTARPGTLYLIVKDWSPEITLPALGGHRPLQAYLLGDRERTLSVAEKGDRWVVTLTGPKPVEPFAVVALTTDVRDLRRD